MTLTASCGPTIYYLFIVHVLLLAGLQLPLMLLLLPSLV